MTDPSKPATDLLSAANVAKALGASEGKVKKAIAALGLAPDAKKGVCNLYGPEAMAKLKAALEG